MKLQELSIVYAAHKEGGNLIESQLKQITLDRLWSTIEMLTNLNEDQFNYGSVIEKVEKVDGHKCGTVCCAMGWYPVNFPEAHLKWDLKELDIKPTRIGLRFAKNIKAEEYETTDLLLSLYHNLNHNILMFLFYGSTLNITKYLTEEGICVIQDIILRWNDNVRFIPKYKHKPAYSLDVRMNYGSLSKLAEVIDGFRFIHYLIQRDYIHAYGYDKIEW